MALNKMSELLALVEGMGRTVGGKCKCVAELIDAVLNQVQSVIIAVLLESESTVSEAISDVRDGFHVEAFSDSLGPSGGGLSNRPLCCSFLDLSFMCRIIEWC